MPVIPENEIKIEDETLENVLQCIRELKKKQKPNKKSVLADDEDEKLFLEVSYKRIPKIDHILSLKLNLKHPCVTDPKSICLIVKDREKGNRNFEEEIFYWREFLNKHDIHVGEIIPYKQLKVEYKTHESKRNLCHGFDLFFVDASLSRLMPCSLGKSFVKKRKMPYGINMSENRVEKEFKRALIKTTMNVTGHGNVSTCQVGFLGQTNQELRENIKEVVKTLSQKLPGGLPNVHSLNLRMSLSESIPIYMAFHSVSEVSMQKTENKQEAVEDEVNTLVRSKAKVYPSGNIKLIPEPVEDLLELEESKFPIENHILGLQDIEKWKKRMGRKNVSEDQAIQILKKKEGQRKRLVEKVKLKAKLQEANFKEAKALKAGQIFKKNKKLNSERSSSITLNPFTPEGEKFIKKSMPEGKVEEIDEEPNVLKWKKKNKLKKMKFAALKDLLEKQRETDVKPHAISLQEEKNEKMKAKLNVSEKLSKNKRKKLLRRSLATPDASNEQKFKQLSPQGLDIDEKDFINGKEKKKRKLLKRGNVAPKLMSNEVKSEQIHSPVSGSGKRDGTVKKQLRKMKKKLLPEIISSIKDLKESERLFTSVSGDKETNGESKKKRKNKRNREISKTEEKKSAFDITLLGSQKKKSYKLEKPNLGQNTQSDPMLLSIKTKVSPHFNSKIALEESPVSLNGKRKKNAQISRIKKHKSS